MSTAAAPTRLRAWMLAARPATLPAAAVPVLVGTAAAASEGAVLRPLVFVATLAAALCIQIGTNFANDYSDFHRGADHEGRLGPVRVTQAGLIGVASVRRGIVVAFGVATLLGAYLAWIGRWPIVAIGLAAIVCGLAYTGGPWPFGYHGLGDLFVFLFFGIVAVTGTAFLQSGAWSARALAASIPIGLLATGILVVNNLRDLPTDRAAGKRTLAVRIGDRATRAQYAALIAGAYLAPAMMAARGGRRAWLLLLPWLSAPLALRLVRTILGGTAGRELNAVLAHTGRLLLVYGLLLSVGLVAAGDR